MKKLVLFLCINFWGLFLFAQTPGTPYLFPTVSSGSVTFSYTGSLQTWTVPYGISRISFTIYGAQGGGPVGGKGGMITGSVPVTAGSTLSIVVGGQASGFNPVYGNGGAGGTSTGNSSLNAYAGGGLSGIFTGSPITQANALVVAGGGGGTTIKGGDVTYDFAGGIGGSPNGAIGAYRNFSGYVEAGGGGTQSSGGSPGSNTDTQTVVPTAGMALQGGLGASVPTGYIAAGGGGGGYFGGGGGRGGGWSRGAGGGGSSWVIATGSSIVYTGGNRTGNGQVVINY